MVAAPHVTAATLGGIVAYAKANPGKLTYGAATGTIAQVAGELLKLSTGTNIVARMKGVTIDVAVWMVPSSQGLDLALGTRDCSSRLAAQQFADQLDRAPTVNALPVPGTTFWRCSSQNSPCLL